MNIERANRIRAGLGLPPLSSRESDNPGLAQRMSNAAGAIKRAAGAAVGGKKVLVSNEERDRRFSICQACEFFTGTTCRKCGCIVSFKTRLETEHCPVGKW